MSKDEVKFEISPDVEIRSLGPGIALLKKALSSDSQIALANWALNAGKHPTDGWFTEDGKLNATPSRGRIYLPVDKYGDPEPVRQLCIDLVRQGQTVTPALPDIDLTHLLLLYYSDGEGMCWHRDSDENDGDNDHPIVSISLGNSCDFAFKQLLKGEQDILLESGDVLIWGGPERMLLHCVRGVRQGTAPEFLPFKDARINFTYRSARNILGKEEQFRSDKYWVDQ
eukprot:TRINITY_DN53172_c0_g1_i1.p1 TRINITY_DN53172_c0_g1~~TRINITY_DN53172_c0_g1_i1.p1  ORF type:complete len:250 (+),score=61.04 TRINITY_DN53172_c0_g1_i1:75-752(+)